MENELAFCMCSLRTVTWRATRHGGEVSDRPCFNSSAGPAHRKATPT